MFDYPEISCQSVFLKTPYFPETFLHCTIASNYEMLDHFENSKTISNENVNKVGFLILINLKKLNFQFFQN